MSHVFAFSCLLDWKLLFLFIFAVVIGLVISCQRPFFLKWDFFVKTLNLMKYTGTFVERNPCSVLSFKTSRVKTDMTEYLLRCEAPYHNPPTRPVPVCVTWHFIGSTSTKHRLIRFPHFRLLGKSNFQSSFDRVSVRLSSQVHTGGAVHLISDHSVLRAKRKFIFAEVKT